MYCLPRRRALPRILMSLINNKLGIRGYFFTAGPYALITPSTQTSDNPPGPERACKERDEPGVEVFLLHPLKDVKCDSKAICR